MSNIPEEQPPEDPTALREWLSRMMILINGAFDNTGVMDAIGKIPGYIIDGLFKYFPNAIDPEIKYPGPWIVVDGVWRPMVGMVFNADYVSGDLSYPQDVVLAGGITFACNEKTTDPAGIFPIGDPDYVTPDAPNWVVNQTVNIVYSVIDIVAPVDKAYKVLSYRFWAPSTSPDYTYEIWSVDYSDPTRPINTKVATYTGDVIEAGWNVRLVDGDYILEGFHSRLVLVTINSLSDVIVTGGWTRGNNEQAVAPATSSWNTTNQLDILRIDKVDLDTIDRTTELLSMGPGTEIAIVDTLQAERSIRFSVDEEPVELATCIEYSVNHLGNGPWGAPHIGNATTMTADTPVPATADYVVLADGSLPYSAIQGGLSTTGSYADVVLSDDLNGIDVVLQEYSKSDSWDVVAGGSGATSSAKLPLLISKIPETTLTESSPETMLANLNMKGQSHGWWRFGYDIEWYITGQGGTQHLAIFRLYFVTGGVDELIFEYSREPKDPLEKDWATKGAFTEYIGQYDSIKLTVQESDGASNPELVIGGGSKMHMEKK